MLKTRKIIASLAALNLIIFGAGFYLLASIKKINGLVSERLTQIESESKKDESIHSIKNLMNDTKKEREQIAKFFIQPNGAVDFIETVESLGKIAGDQIEVDSVAVEDLKDKTASSTESFRISLKTESLWSNTIHLLSLLEDMPYKISFNSINLVKISGKSGPDAGRKAALSRWNGAFSFSVLKIKNLQDAPTNID